MPSPYPIEVTTPTGAVRMLGLAAFVDPVCAGRAGRSGETITLTYVVAPTWDWFGL